MENQSEHKVTRYFFLAVILLFAVFLISSLIEFFTAFLAAIMFYVLSKPFVGWLVKKKHWKKSLAAILVIFISFFVILLPVTILVGMLYGKVSSVVANPQDILAGVKHFDASMQQKFGIQIISDKNIATAQAFAATVLSLIVNQGIGFFSTMIMMYFFLYFMIQNSGRMEAAIILFLPFQREKINMFGNELVAQTFSNAVGIPLISVIQGICGFICYLIADVHQPGFWAVITGFASVIPIVGSAIVWVPMSVYLLVTGQTWQGCFVIGWCVIIVSIVDNVTRFALAKRMADVHPIITVLGVIMGLKYFGFTGLIFGPLLISYFFILLQIYYVEYQKPQRIVKKEKKRQLLPTYIQPFLGIKKVKKKL
jgi:predicted PurR-regulated permease PerM